MIYLHAYLRVFLAELGDYDSRRHFAHYTDALCLTENTIPMELEQAITRLHRTKHR